MAWQGSYIPPYGAAQKPPVQMRSGYGGGNLGTGTFEGFDLPMYQAYTSPENAMYKGMDLGGVNPDQNDMYSAIGINPNSMSPLVPAPTADINAMLSTAGPGLLDRFKSFMGGAVGTRDAPGWGGLALGAATGLANTYMGMKQYGLAQDMFSENKRQYAQNFDAQRGLTNSRLEDRQTRRNIERPDSMAAADYMSKYGVK